MTSTRVQNQGITDSSVTTSKLADSSVTNSKVANSAISASKLDGNQPGNPPVYGVRAWVNFNPTTSPLTIRSSGNIQTVTYLGVGSYRIIFSTPMPDANYAVCAMMGTSSAEGDNIHAVKLVNDSENNIVPTVNSFVIYCSRVKGGESGDNFVDRPTVSVIVLR